MSAFSQFKRELNKNYLRTRTGDERLEGLMTLAVEREVAAELSLDQLVYEFAKFKDSRYPFLH